MFMRNLLFAGVFDDAPYDGYGIWDNDMPTWSDQIVRQEAVYISYMYNSWQNVSTIKMPGLFQYTCLKNTIVSEPDCNIYIYINIYI